MLSPTASGTRAIALPPVRYPPRYRCPWGRPRAATGPRARQREVQPIRAQSPTPQPHAPEPHHCPVEDWLLTHLLGALLAARLPILTTFAQRFEQQRTFRICGSVVNGHTGSPVGGAMIRMSSNAGTSLTTGYDGSFAGFPLTPQSGLVRVHISSPGYDTKIIDVEVGRAGKEATLAVELRPTLL